MHVVTQVPSSSGPSLTLWLCATWLNFTSGCPVGSVRCLSRDPCQMRSRLQQQSLPPFQCTACPTKARSSKPATDCQERERVGVCSCRGCAPLRSEPKRSMRTRGCADEIIQPSPFCVSPVRRTGSFVRARCVPAWLCCDCDCDCIPASSSLLPPRSEIRRPLPSSWSSLHPSSFPIFTKPFPDARLPNKALFSLADALQPAVASTLPNTLS